MKTQLLSIKHQNEAQRSCMDAFWMEPFDASFLALPNELRSESHPLVAKNQTELWHEYIIQQDNEHAFVLGGGDFWFAMLRNLWVNLKEARTQSLYPLAATRILSVLMSADIFEPARVEWFVCFNDGLASVTSGWVAELCIICQPNLTSRGQSPGNIVWAHLRDIGAQFT